MHTIKLKIAKTVLKDGRTPGNITLPDTKLHYRDTVIKKQESNKNTLVAFHAGRKTKNKI